MAFANEFRKSMEMWSLKRGDEVLLLNIKKREAGKQGENKETTLDPTQLRKFQEREQLYQH